MIRRTDPVEVYTLSFSQTNESLCHSYRIDSETQLPREKSPRNSEEVETQKTRLCYFVKTSRTLVKKFTIHCPVIEGKSELGPILRAEKQFLELNNPFQEY